MKLRNMERGRSGQTTDEHYIKGKWHKFTKNGGGIKTTNEDNFKQAIS